MPKINARPDQKLPNYDIVLTDGQDYVGLIGKADQLGRNPVEQTSLKTTTGNQSYSDLIPPYMVIAQDDWTGGRASREFEKDVTRYKDGLRANTERASGVILYGRETYCDGLRDDDRSLPGSMKMQQLTGARRYLAKRFSAGEDKDATGLWFWVRKKGTPRGPLIVALYDDDSNAVGSELQSASLAVADMNALVSELKLFAISSESLTGTTNYWTVAYGADGDDDNNHWEIGVNTASGTTKKSADGSTWAAETIDMYYRVVETNTQTGGHFFEYKKGWYFITKPNDGSAASKLYLNGARGLGASNAGNLDKLIASANHGLTEAQATGAIIMVIEGAGSSEEQNWRVITGVPSSVSFSVDEDWLIAHDSTTVWVVIGADIWTEIDWSSYITKPVTSVLVSTQAIAYFAQGEADNIVRMKEEIDTGAWVRTFADDSTNKAIHLTEYNNSGMKIVRTNGDGTSSECATPTTWTDLASWTSPTVAVGDKWDRFTNAIPYKDYNLDDIAVLFKEGGPWQWKNGSADESTTPEMAAVASYKNGLVAFRQGSYLYFSVQNTLWRFYHPNYDDVGPTNDEGLPVGRQGNISFGIAYPGRVVVGVDAGPSGYSSILVNSGGTAYHEMYRAPYGQRITAGGLQVIPGSTPDRLWLRQGADIVYLPMPSETYDPYQDTSYPFTHEFVLELGNMTAGLYDAWKYWKSLKLRTLNLIQSETTGERTTWIECDYRTSEEDEWTTLPDDFTISPVQEQDFDDYYGVSSQVLYLRIRGYSTDSEETPKLTALAIAGVTVTQPKFSYELTAVCSYTDKDGLSDTMLPEDKVKKLDEWCGTARPLRLYSGNALFDDIAVFLMPLPARPRATAQAVGEHDYQVNIVLQEA